MQQGNYNNPNPGQQYGQPNPNQYQQGFGQQVNLPNATGVLVLGILSIVFAGLIGLILAIIALSMAGKAKAEYNSNPGRYTAASMSRVNAGRVCAIIGLCLLGLVLLIVILAAAAS